MTKSNTGARQSPRFTKLTRYFNDIISGRLPLDTAQNAELFIEGLCAQPDQPTCIERLISSQSGLQSIQACMRKNISHGFLNGAATNLILYLQDPTLKTICGGDFLQQIVSQIVEPPTFWSPFLKCFRDGGLGLRAQQAFAWLLSELILLPFERSVSYIEIASDLTIQGNLTTSPQLEIRTLGQRIKHVLSALRSESPPQDEFGPGGRHDNDFVDFRKIAILPTADELLSAEEPFIRLASVVEELNVENGRLLAHLDNQFRLLREDMLGEVREELKVVLGKTKGRHRGMVVDGFTVLGIHCKEIKKCEPWRLQLQCKEDIPQIRRLPLNDRKEYLDKNGNIFKHMALCCLILDGEIAAFATIDRDVDLLAKSTPVVNIKLSGEAATSKALLGLKTSKRIKLVQLDTAVFAFEPILKALQSLKALPLVEELLCWKPGSSMHPPASLPSALIDCVERDPRRDLKHLLGTSSSILLDESQSRCLLTGLKQRVSLVQGPPGTGKSFIGALVAKILYQFTNQSILVVCFTNHALDQFLEELLDIQIPAGSMVRLGGKSTTRTEELSIHKQQIDFKHNKNTWKIIDELRSKSASILVRLRDSFGRYLTARPHKGDIMEHLEFSPDGQRFHTAFKLPTNKDGMALVGKKGRIRNEFYLIDQWYRGQKAGAFKAHIIESSKDIWELDMSSRRILIASWEREILKTQVEEFCNIAQEFDDCQEKLDRIFQNRNTEIMKSKRIIGCTTTAAAKYTLELQASSRDVVLVEEAGEILESHILTALGPQTQRLILIGDHKQLRPKVKNYRLSVEKGAGYDLNRSLFERLILLGFPHQTLSQQHRMRPEISSLVRSLTYPDLVDASKTKGRPHLRGFQHNLMFVSHDFPEKSNQQAVDLNDNGFLSSKQNTHEAAMALQCVRYLGQQGYGTEKIVILTPYLGQLQLLQKMLNRTRDPILNDLNSYDLVRAGLLPAASAKISKQRIHISTIENPVFVFFPFKSQFGYNVEKALCNQTYLVPIMIGYANAHFLDLDNYQGEEKDIVIACLTRSNERHEIGFMASPERLNVLLSRARNALIIIGNAVTFQNSQTGGNVWKKFFDLLRQGGHIHDGFPVKCERHSDRKALLRVPTDFDDECRDGGCKEPCGTLLSCGLHMCPQRCHQLSNHSKMPCDHVLSDKCPKGHVTSWKCHQNDPTSCQKCEGDAELLVRKQQKALELQGQRERDEREHIKRMAELDEQMEAERQKLKDIQLSKDRSLAAQQKLKDLENLKALDPDPQKMPLQKIESHTPSNKAVQNIPKPKINETRHDSVTLLPAPAHASHKNHESGARKEWQYQKNFENASNDAIDSVMEMIGLEEVKAQILKIKAKVDVSLRQNSNLNDDRFNTVFQGNPGTGKTTVARHYAKILSTFGVLPGSAFVEASGSRLASDGINGVKKHIEEIQNAGGGVIFVDEAYQLVGEQNYRGRDVLDFLLAEMENNVGSIVVILAGYNKEMEKLFEHNPGLASRIPYSFQFTDYEDDELLLMFRQLIEKKFNGKMKIEGDGADQESLFLRIATRRLGRSRNRPGFGNARSLQILFSRVLERQADRLSRERRTGSFPDDNFLSKEDLIGPDPSSAIKESKAWRKLQEMTGLAAVKKSVQIMIDRLKTNYIRELKEQSPMEVSLNRVFLGSPGTGKTSVAKLYGQILADLGLLSNGEVVLKNPADFVGSVLGQSEENTKAILAATVGKILVIDEAYMLYCGKDGSGIQNDIYKTAVIDTMVAEIQSVPGEDRCVLLLGYKDEIVTMFQNVNPGLSRRFAIENAFDFQDFTDSELLSILELKLKQQDLSATKEAKSVAINVLSRARNRPNFGNAGEVENLLGLAKNRYQARQLDSQSVSEGSFDVIFEPQDFDEDFDRGRNAITNLNKLFEDVVGCEETIAKLKGYQQTAQNLQILGRDMRDMIPTNFLFKGPPGTGKTTTARKMGQVFYDMGFISKVEVIECSASDLIGQYVGSTGPKTLAQLDKALGKVLFVDEAYRLAEGNFGTEAINELVDSLTKPKYMGKMIVILAGYDKDINQLIAVNPGLSSRFPEEIVFRNMNIENSLYLLENTIKKKEIQVPNLKDPKASLHLELVKLIENLASLPSWGNARDIISLGTTIARGVFGAKLDPMLPLKASYEDIVHHTKSLLAERQSRCRNLPSRDSSTFFSQMAQTQDNEPLIDSIATAETAKDTKLKEEKKASLPQVKDFRDPNVSNKVWRQLQADKEAADRALKVSEDEIEIRAEELRQAEEVEGESITAAKKLAQTATTNDDEMNELKRLREAARIQEQTARIAHWKALAEYERLKTEAENRKRHEAQMQAKLRKIGVCVAGYQWIKQSGGYRCAGGSHFVSNARLKM